MPAKTWGRRPRLDQVPREDWTSHVPPSSTRPYSKSPLLSSHDSPRFINRAPKLRCSQPALSGVTRMYSPGADPGRTCKGELRVIDLPTLTTARGRIQQKLKTGYPSSTSC